MENKKLIIIGIVVVLLICCLSLFTFGIAFYFFDDDEGSETNSDERQESSADENDEQIATEENNTGDIATTLAEAKAQAPKNEEEQKAFLQEAIAASNQETQVEGIDVSELTMSGTISTDVEGISLDLDLVVEVEQDKTYLEMIGVDGGLYFINTNNESYFSNDNNSWYNIPVSSEEDITSGLTSGLNINNSSELSEFIDDENFEFIDTVECGEFFCNKYLFTELESNQQGQTYVYLDVDNNLPRQMDIVVEGATGELFISYDDVNVEIPENAQKIDEDQFGELVFESIFGLFGGDLFGGQ